MFSAQYRFFIDVFFVVFFVLFYKYFDKKINSRVLRAWVNHHFNIIFSRHYPNVHSQLQSGWLYGRFKKEQLYRPSTYEYRKFKSFNIGNLKFNVSENYPYNFDTPLPAISPVIFLMIWMQEFSPVDRQK